MIKKIIFDLDNTLILWKNEYINFLKEVTIKYGIEKYYKDIDAILETEEKLHDTLTKEQLLEDINVSCHLSLNIDFVDDILESQKKASDPTDKDLQETIKYLSNKYELVVLTNWFTDTQKGRLKHAKILKYFTDVYGGDQGNIKPHKEAFKRAIGNNKIEECIMIGDDNYHDIDGALNVGLKVIQVDLKNKIKYEKEYPVIKNIKELMDIL
ncbi:MAG: HAD family hydrolase [Bacilli bacterium]|nr:HAD family hydrolase [Bacilli bacterium]